MRSRIAVWCVGIILIIGSSAQAAGVMSEQKTQRATESLTAFFEKLTTLQANFKQIIENAQLAGGQGSAPQAAGKLWIERPGKFRWDYLTPYEQEIVSDGSKIWIFDKDLEQVTVRAISGNMENTPAVLLSDSKPIRETFTVIELGESYGLHWVELLPKDREASFTAIRLGFERGEFRKMLMEDNLGQVTKLTFSHVVRNAEIDASKFLFKAPAGVDIFETQ